MGPSQWDGNGTGEREGPGYYPGYADPGYRGNSDGIRIKTVRCPVRYLHSYGSGNGENPGVGQPGKAKGRILLGGFQLRAGSHGARVHLQADDPLFFVEGPLHFGGG